MHPAVFATFDDLCAGRGAGGDVLEIGARPRADTLLELPSLRGARSRIGLDLDGPYERPGYRIVRGDAHAMSAFADRSFDTVVCNAMLEHDARFWLTLAEIRRVARPGALVVLGVPAYGEPSFPPWSWLVGLARRGGRAPVVGALLGAPVVGALLGRAGLDGLAASVPTLALHAGPGDYYRFSRQAMREILCEGLVEVEIRRCLDPPRLVGAGRIP